MSLVEDFSSTVAPGEGLLVLLQLPYLGLVKGNLAVSIFVMNVPLAIFTLGHEYSCLVNCPGNSSFSHFAVRKQPGEGILEAFNLRPMVEAFVS